MDEFMKTVVDLSTAPRPAVQWFAGEMEAKLKENDHKGGWLNEDPLWLLGRLLEEARELELEIYRANPDPDKIRREAADVANISMMLADIFNKRIG